MDRQMNPFVYGRPLFCGEFINRELDLRTLFGRIYNKQTSAIVGALHIGKTSLLHYMMDQQVQYRELGEAAIDFTFLYIDCQEWFENQGPIDFWNRVTAPLREPQVDEAIRRQVDLVAANGFTLAGLEELFQLWGRRNKCIVLLLDDFDTLLNHANFQRPDFFVALRTLTNRTKGFEFVLANHMSVADMNRQARKIQPTGSPLFNYLIEFHLGTFSHTGAAEIVKRTLQLTGDPIQFSDQDYDFILSWGGTHPFLVQTAAASLYDAMRANPEDGDRYSRAKDLFFKRTEAHFDESWSGLDESQRRAMLLLALGQYHGRIHGRSFNLDELDKLDQYTVALHRLQDQGIVKPGPAGAGSQKHKPSWQIVVGGIVPWLVDKVISSPQDPEYCASWLHDKEYVLGLFTREQITQVGEIVRKFPKIIVEVISDIIQNVLSPWR